MGDKTKIEWTSASWNPTRGCTKVSAGCKLCYAETQAKRFCGAGQPYEGTIERGRWNGKVRLVPEKLLRPVRWQRPRYIFVNSMSDLFHEDIPDEYILAVFGVMSAARHHQFQVLTKRPERAARWFAWAEKQWSGPERWKVGDPYVDDVLFAAAEQTAPHDMHWPRRWEMTLARNDWPLPNVWIGVSVENQETADTRIPWLLRIPAVIRWLSMEPLIGGVTIAKWLGTVHEDSVGIANLDQSIPAALGVPFHDPWLRGVDWVVVGGESGGRHARPLHPTWARTIRDECANDNVPFFFKQWGEHAPWSDDHFDTGAYPDGEDALFWMHDNGAQAGLVSSTHATNEKWHPFLSVGKGAAGRLLDGRLHDDLPRWSS